MAKKESAKEWCAENDLRTLMEADEIREDEERMTAVRNLAKEKLVDMAKISTMATEKPDASDKD